MGFRTLKENDGSPAPATRSEEILDEAVIVEQDLESFMEHWKESGWGKLRTEYHKDGAPFMDSPEHDSKPPPGPVPDDVDTPIPPGKFTGESRNTRGDAPPSPAAKTAMDIPAGVATGKATGGEVGKAVGTAPRIDARETRTAKHGGVRKTVGAISRNEPNTAAEPASGEVERNTAGTSSDRGPPKAAETTSGDAARKSSLPSSGDGQKKASETTSDDSLWKSAKPESEDGPKKASETTSDDSLWKSAGPASGDGPGKTAGAATDDETEDTAGAAAKDGGGTAAGDFKTRIFDIRTVEVLAATVVHALLGRKFHVPLKKEGLIDADVYIRDTDVVFNANRVQLEVPELSLWRFVFAYKGRTVVEYGRGVKNNIRIHYFGLIMAALDIWVGGRKRRQARERAHVKNASSSIIKSVEVFEAKTARTRGGR